MTLDEKQVYYASILNDLAILNTHYKKQKKSTLDIPEQNVTISTCKTLQNVAFDILLKEFILNGAPFSFVNENIVVKTPKISFSMKKKEFPELDSLQENDIIWENIDFPLRSNAILNGGAQINLDKICLIVPKNTEGYLHAAGSDPNQIFVDRLLMNVYQISYPDNEKEKIMTVIAAPLKNPEEDVLSVPLFAMAKKDGKIITAASNPESRASLILNVGGESITLKGTWARNRFKTFVYPQKTQGRDIGITKKEYSPQKSGSNIGHYVFKEENMEIHVLPMSTKNNDLGFVQFIACKRTLTDTGNRNIVDISPNGKDLVLDNCVISAKWENNALEVEVKKEKTD